QDAERVHAHDAVEIVFVDFHEGKRLVEAGVVEHHVEPAEAFDSLLNRVANLPAVRDVNGDGQRGTSVLGQAVGDGLGLCAVDVGNRDRGAVFGQAASNPFAEPLSAPGDNCDLVLKPGHVVFL